MLKSTLSDVAELEPVYTVVGPYSSGMLTAD